MIAAETRVGSGLGPNTVDPDAAFDFEAAEAWQPRRHIIAGLVLVALVVVGFGIWAAIVPLSAAVVASGEVRGESNRQYVQHLEGGIVKSILVKNGDVVSAGQPLIELDMEKPLAELAAVETTLFEARAKEARLLAESLGQNKIVFRPDLLAQARDDPDLRDILDGQQQQFSARLKTLEREEAELAVRAQRTQKATASSQEQIAAMRQRLALTREQLKKQRELLDRGYTTQDRVFALEVQVSEASGELERLLGEVGQSRDLTEETQVGMTRLAAEWHEALMKELRDLSPAIADLRSKKAQLGNQIGRSVIRAPIAGVVTSLAVHTQQGVIKAGEPLLSIVPTSGPLVIEARIPPQDIDQIDPGQDAIVRFSAFNHRTTPEIAGKVIKVAADRSVDSQQNSFYVAEIALPADPFGPESHLKLVAGMPVEAFIKTGSRTFWSYLLKPLTDNFNRAFKEE